MPRFRLTLEYDGTDFAGWQLQPRGERTVQGVLEAAIASVCGAPVRVTAAGRTDAGVHAQAQLASVEIATRLDPATLRRAFNARLPADVAVHEVAPAPADFDARRAARTKHYRYAIWNGRNRSPLRARRFAFVRTPLDAGAMREAAARLEGEHDFLAFAATGWSGRSSVRRIDRLEVGGEAGGEIRLDVHGPGFLRHMVRNLAGTLIEVGQGRRAPDAMPALLASRDRRLAGPTAPAHGLCLVAVHTG